MGGAGGDGVLNFGTITTLTNRGAIRGGNGGNGPLTGGNGGAGVSNAGTITTLTNRGKIVGGTGGTGPVASSGGDAIDSTGSIGTIANSGQIIGNVEIDNQESVTVNGGTGKTFGGWTGGAITIGNGNLSFAGGNTTLGDDVEVDGGARTVINNGKLQCQSASKIDPPLVNGADGSARPGGAGRGCAAGGSAVR